MISFSQLGSMGELGNQLFQVAATLSHAKRMNTVAKFPVWKCNISGRDYREIFKTPIDQTLDSSKIEYIYSEPEFTYRALPMSDNFDMRGYFQSERYFDDNETMIREMFSPNDDIESKLKLHEKLYSREDVVAVQIRTGKRDRNDYDVHAYASEDFLNESMKNFKPGTHFVCFADNREIARTIIPKNITWEFLDPMENYMDLFLMSKFKNFIVSPSTFGWWAAWLSQNKTKRIYIKKDWFACGSQGDKRHLNQNDIIPNSSRWIKIDK